MKKIICAVFAAVLMLLMAAGCGDNNAVTYEQDFYDTKVNISVSLDDGWDIDFDDEALTVFDGPKDDMTSKVIANGMILSERAYERTVEKYEDTDGFKKTDDGVRFTNDSGSSSYIFKASDDIYYVITVRSGYDAESVFKRFEVKAG